MTEPRVPPHDLDAEGMVLSSVLFDPSTFVELGLILNHEHFYADANRRIWQVMSELEASGRPIDVSSVTARLRDCDRLEQVGGTPYIGRLAEYPVALRPEEQAERVVTKWRLRQVIRETQTIAAEAYTVGDEADEFIQSAEARVFALSQQGTKPSSSLTMRTVVQDCLAEITRRFKREVQPGLSTGFESLDRRIGWLRKGRMYVAAGRPGMGKTSFLVQCGRAVARSDGDARGVFLASLEMPRDQIGDRQIAQECMLDTRAVDSGFLRADQFREVCNKSAELAKWPMIIDDTPGMTLSVLRGLVRRAVRVFERDYGTRLGLVGIDYLQLMGRSDLPRCSSTNDEIEKLSAGIATLAKEFNVPVILLSQLNRDCEKRPDKRPQLSDLRSSGAIEQDAWGIVFLYRDDQYRKPGETKDNRAEFIVAKARGGSTGAVSVGFVPYCALFVDEKSDDPDDEFARLADELGDAVAS